MKIRILGIWAAITGSINALKNRKYIILKGVVGKPGFSINKKDRGHF